MGNLNQFLQTLWESGNVQVEHEVQDFAADDLAAAQVTLAEQEAQLRSEFPGEAPAFDSAAALWAAQYLYRALQLLLLRHLAEEKIQDLLQNWPKAKTPAAIYSADLCLRHLPILLGLAKKLSPEDPLVLCLTNLASAWPFSGLDLAEADPQAEAVLLSHPSLAQAYVDRIIARRLREKAQEQTIRPWVAAALGDHAEQLWPDWNLPLQRL
jgi:hypothetical protein